MPTQMHKGHPSAADANVQAERNHLLVGLSAAVPILRGPCDEAVELLVHTEGAYVTVHM